MSELDQNPSSIDNEQRNYLVRTIPELVEKGIVGLGWVDFKFCDYGDAEEVIKEINNAYGIGRYGNQIRRFFSISDGDVIVAPLPHSVAIGRAAGGQFYDENYYDEDRANQRKINFPRDPEGRVISIPRSSFSEAFQRRLRVMGMVVNDLTEFRDEIRSALLRIDAGGDHSWLNQFNEKKEAHKEDFRKRLLANIQSGRTNLKTGGCGLEELVKELLQAEGYEARVLSKRQFNGFADADVEAFRSDRWSTVKILIQVKHHQGYSNAHGLNQLREIKQAHSGEYDDYLSVFLTTASVSEEMRKQAVKDGITVMDGEALVEWIEGNIDHLAEKTKNLLGVYELPAVI